MGHDEDQPERAWWFTIGGGIEEGEDPRAAAVREVFEETGIRLKHPIWSVPFSTGPPSSISWPLPLAKTSGSSSRTPPSTTLSRDGWTELERSVIDTQRWWDIDEAAATIDGEIYPAQILEYARAWRDGWDGHMIRLTDTREP